MLKVLIVEDDEFVSMGLRNMVRWQQLGMEVVGEARDGREGLSLYEQESPDIILADIRMPVMTGIEMIEQIRKQDARTRIVVFSCHEDYEYVRQAFKLGISDYILKVRMMPEDIETIMERVRGELLSMQAGESETKEREEFSREEILEKCRASLLDPEGSSRDFSACAAALGLPGEGELAVCAMEVTLPEHGAEEAPEGKRQIVLELVQKKLSQREGGLVLWEQGSRYLLVVPLPEGKGGREQMPCLERLLKELLEEVRILIQTYVNGSVTFGVSSRGGSYREVHRLYAEGLEAQRRAFFQGEGILYYGKAPDSEKYGEALSVCEKKIAEAKWLSDGCRQKIGKEIAFQKSLKETDIDTMKEIFSRWSHRVSFDSTVQRKETLRIVLETAKQIRAAATLEELVDVFGRYLDTMSRVKEPGLVCAEVAAAIAYIRERFWDEDICLAGVAGHVGMSKDYLSTVFKRDTGQGFSDYVNSVRIGRACELLENTVMKAYEISQAVGFRDESYFSRIFKKMVGMRPNEYRRRELALEEDRWREKEDKLEIEE